MKKRLFLIGLALILVTFTDAQRRKYGYDPDKYPEVLEKGLFKDADNLEKLFGFIDGDFSSKDMTRLSREFMALQAFDQRTLWPEQDRLPGDFQPERWLEIGKGPGLNVSELHRRGITGKKVAVAVFDKYINPDHVEFEDRIVFHKIKSPLAEDFQYRMHFHGMACASILCGKTLGVAPDATLHYFAGLAALAWSIEGSLTIEDIYRLIKETKTRTSQGRYVVNPLGFIEGVLSTSCSQSQSRSRSQSKLKSKSKSKSKSSQSKLRSSKSK